MERPEKKASAVANQRDFFRLEYPQPDRPTIEIAGEKIPVLDVSEQGIKVSSSRRFSFKAKMEIRGRITFLDKSGCDVAGTVLRVLEDGNIVIQLTTGVPLGKMMEEQRHLIKKYKRDE